MKINFKDVHIPTEGLYIVGIYENKSLSSAAEKINSQLNGLLTYAMDHNHFSGKFREILPITVPASSGLAGVVLVGLGRTELDPFQWEMMGGTLISYLQSTPEKKATIDLSDEQLLKENSVAEKVSFIANGALLRSWRFDKYLTQKDPQKQPMIEELVFCTPHISESKTKFNEFVAVDEGVFFTRHLVSEPANIINPETMAETIQQLKEIGLEIEVLGEKDMKKLGMNALLGVGQGSDKESKLIILQWKHGARDQKPLIFVGKGITFDTGGISIKPSNGMEDMIYDMAGSASIAGLMIALAKRNAKVNVVGIMAMAENMPDGKAQRPGDIVRAMSGLTIEVLNTDAEGRLVLADALWYAQDRFKPQLMVDLATLTGAISVALGENEYAGLFSNNEVLAHQLQESGKKVRERLWSFPMDEAYGEMIKGDHGDIRNTGKGRGAGSITAAKFLENFVNKLPWAHLDIANMAWNKKPTAFYDKGATGFGVRLLNQFVKDYFEE
jgi:leucyl aminopeptidase